MEQNNNKCTWQNCNNFAVHKILNSKNKIWAELCNEHNNILNDAIVNSNPLRLLGIYSKANGGAEKLANKLISV
jgi:hypothetical protein